VRPLLAALGLALLTSGATAAPALWEARDADSRVVIFGSVHALPPDLEWRTPLLDQAVAGADLVYFETDIGPLGMTALAIKILVQQFQTMREPWLDRLTAEQMDLLIEAIGPLGIGLEEVAITPPWVVAMELTDLSLRRDEMGGTMDMASGVESVLQWELPKERKGYFETPGQQFDMLAGGTLDEQIEQLFMTIEDGGIGGGDEDLGDIVRAWAAGEPEKLEMVPKSDDEAAVLDLLIVQRNRNWIPAIETMLKDNRENLIVVGAGHLSGEDSVLDLLSEAGYTVTRIQ
jgi:uncharacterized protein YbaP (TraB family)